MATVYQECILDAIDHVNDVVLESEYSVVMALCDSYLKSAIMVQESNTIAADEMFMESAFGDKAKAAGNWVKEAPKKLWELIKRVWKTICDFLASIPRKIKEFVRRKKADRAANKAIKTSELAQIYKKAGCRVRAEGDGWVAEYPGVPDGDKILPALDMLNSLFGAFDDLVSNHITNKSDSSKILAAFKKLNMPKTFSDLSKAIDSTKYSDELFADDEEIAQGFAVVLQKARQVEATLKRCDNAILQMTTTALDVDNSNNPANGFDRDLLQTLLQHSQQCLKQVQAANQQYLATCETRDKLFNEINGKINSGRADAHEKHDGAIDKELGRSAKASQKGHLKSAERHFNKALDEGAADSLIP